MFVSVVPVREKSSEPAQEVVKRKPYSPFQNTSNKVEFAVARADDLLNWARKASMILYEVDLQRFICGIYFSFSSNCVLEL